MIVPYYIIVLGEDHWANYSGGASFRVTVLRLCLVSSIYVSCDQILPVPMKPSDLLLGSILGSIMVSAVLSNLMEFVTETLNI